MRAGLLGFWATAKRRGYKQTNKIRRKNMRLKFAIGSAALTVGAALASVPAVAQQQGAYGLFLPRCSGCDTSLPTSSAL